MGYRVVRLGFFEKQLKDIYLKYSRAKDHIESVINNLTPQHGDNCTGYGGNQIRKLRIGLKSYKIGKSGGLRLLFLVLPPKVWIIPINIYSKVGFRSEEKVKSETKEALKQVLKEIDSIS
jgi:hypothetical protein